MNFQVPVNGEKKFLVLPLIQYTNETTHVLKYIRFIDWNQGGEIVAGN